jgi:predicted ATPase
MLLLQQPEVHLHPRAQAALGSFFARIAAISQVMVETHSDYLVDRIRSQVAAGLISASKVLILYFELADGATTVHPIHLDDHGNLIDPPPSYRDFFFEEEIRVLTRSSG